MGHPDLESTPGPDCPDLPSSSLLVVPASLIANWKAELLRFAPSLCSYIAHPSEPGSDLKNPEAIRGCDLVITTYTMLCRLDWLRQRKWKLTVLDEARPSRIPASGRGGRRRSCARNCPQTVPPVELIFPNLLWA